MPEKVKIEEEKRGGTEDEPNVPRPIKDPGQGIFVYATPEENWIWPETPNLAREFLDQLNHSKAPNGCIMLPGNLQYWKPCRWVYEDFNVTFKGTEDIEIDEPIHFAGPSPGEKSKIAKEKKMEITTTSEPVQQPPMNNEDDPQGAAQQTPPQEITPLVQRPIKEDTKEPEPPVTVEHTDGAAVNAPSLDAPPRVMQQPIDSVQQSASPSQATLYAV